MKKKILTGITFAVVVLVTIYTVFIYFLVSACLVPSFMEKLDVFEEITEKGYSEQVHTSDISENRKEALTQTKEWLETAQGQKLRKKTEDGYELAPDMHSHRTRHRRTISVRSHVFLADHSL